MAEDTTEATDDIEPEGTVTLVSPSGAEYRTHSAVEINNLVYGQGYKHKADAPAEAGQSEKDGPAVPPAETASTTEAPTAPPSSTAAEGKAPAKASAGKASTSGTSTPPSST